MPRRVSGLFVSTILSERKPSKLCDVYGLGAFLALDHIKFDFLSLFERFEALAVDTGIVHEYIISVRIADKTEPTLIVETSNYALTHVVTSKLLI
jgi:hypothetical protein